MVKDPGGELDVGRFAELAAKATRYGLGAYLKPPMPELSLEKGAGWEVGVIAVREGEPLGYGGTLAEAVEHAFLPLDQYIQAGLAEEFDYNAQVQPDEGSTISPDTDLERFAELAAKASANGFGLWVVPPWPSCRPESGSWVIGVLDGEAVVPLAVGSSFDAAVISTFSPMDKVVRKGELPTIWISGDRTHVRRVWGN